MKLNYLIKIMPFLSTFTLIALLNISNQKVNTKLKILIWNTPSLSLGSYLAISTGTGFIFSFILTTSLAKSISQDQNLYLHYFLSLDKSNDNMQDQPNQHHQLHNRL